MEGILIIKHSWSNCNTFIKVFSWPSSGRIIQIYESNSAILILLKPFTCWKVPKNLKHRRKERSACKVRKKIIDLIFWTQLNKPFKLRFAWIFQTSKQSISSFRAQSRSRCLTHSNWLETPYTGEYLWKPVRMIKRAQRTRLHALSAWVATWMESMPKLGALLGKKSCRATTSSIPTASRTTSDLTWNYARGLHVPCVESSSPSLLSAKMKQKSENTKPRFEILRSPRS